MIIYDTEYVYLMATAATLTSTTDRKYISTSVKSHSSCASFTTAITSSQLPQPLSPYCASATTSIKNYDTFQTTVTEKLKFIVATTTITSDSKWSSMNLVQKWSQLVFDPWRLIFKVIRIWQFRWITPSQSWNIVSCPVSLWLWGFFVFSNGGCGCDDEVAQMFVVEVETQRCFCFQ